MSTKEQNKLQDTAFMARSPVKDAIEYDFTSSAEETLDFHDDTLRGEVKHVCYFPQEVNSMGRYKY